MKPRAPKQTPSSKSPKAKSAPDSLTGEEQALWRYVANSITPIKAKHHVRKHGTSIDPADESEASLPPRRPGRAKPAPPPAPASPAPRIAATPSPALKTPPPLTDFDPRKAKKISTGRAAIDARIDLHGMRQDDALARLRGFLFEAHARGHKTILVITGKGRAEDDPTTPYVDTLDRHPRGVLRRNLPHWLAEPDLRSIVVSYTQAPQHHGGDGAFYVELRRRT